MSVSDAAIQLSRIEIIRIPPLLFNVAKLRRITSSSLYVTTTNRISSATSRFRVQSQHVQGLKDEAKLETLIHHVREKKLYAYCLQETWLQGDFKQDLKDGMK
jgi:hypothetical protein